MFCVKVLRANCLFVLVVVLSVFANAQQPYHVQLNNQNVLSTNTIYNILQDDRGYVWMATDDGLLRYDSFETKFYKSNKQTSVAGSSLKQDKYGRIWYENFDGFLYYVEQGKLKSLVQNPPVGYIPFGLTDHYLFVVQKNGIDVFDLKTLKRIKTFLIPITIEAESTAATPRDFYFIADDVMYRIDERLQLSSYKFFVNKGLKIKYIYPLSDKLYVVSKFNETETIYFFDFNLKWINSVAMPLPQHIQGSNFLDDHIWIHTAKGTFQLDHNGRTLSAQALFPNNSTSAILKDKQNKYWISTTDNGVLVIPNLKDEYFPVVTESPIRIQATDYGYLLGTQSGEIISLNKNFGGDRKLSSNAQNVPINFLYVDSVDQNVVYSSSTFTLVKKGNFSTNVNYNVALKDIVRLDDKYYAFAASGLSAIFKNPSYNLTKPSVWDALFSDYQDADNKAFARVLNSVRGKSVAYDSIRQTIVFATNVGVFSVKQAKIVELKNANQSFYAARIRFVENAFYALDTKGNLYKIDRNNRFTKINYKLGIADDGVVRIKKSNDKLLIVTRNNVLIYQPKLDKVQAVPISIENNHINDVLLEDDKLVVLTNRGILKLSIYNPKNEGEIPFWIDFFSANGKSYNPNTTIELSYNQNDVEIGFSILEYGDKKSNAYYRINHGEWLLIGKNSRTINFPSLSSGDYVIEFKVNNKLSPYKLKFEIYAPFWKLWWFYLLSFILVVSVILMYFRWTSNNMKNKIKLLNEKVVLEKDLRKSMLTSIKSQMNPHFFYNALNTIQAYIFTNDKQKANSYLAKFSKLTRLILEMTEKDTVALNEEIEALRLYLELEKMRFSGDFEFEIRSQTIDDKEGIELPPMLIQPYVENAVKHGLLHKKGAKELKISFEQIDDRLRVSIDDNGIGRKASEQLNQIKNQKHQSFSTQANDKRLEILNKELVNKMTLEINDKYDSLGHAEGTRVVITIPI